MKQVQLFCFSLQVDGTPTYTSALLFRNCISFCVCLVCVYVPTTVCRKLCDRAQGAEGPLGAAVRQGCRVAAEKTPIKLISHLDKGEAKCQ